MFCRTAQEDIVRTYKVPLNWQMRLSKPVKLSIISEKKMSMNGNEAPDPMPPRVPMAIISQSTGSANRN